MRERPILFSAPMVRAILAGTKTQTRRVAKWKPREPGLNLSFSGLHLGFYNEAAGARSGWVLRSRDGGGRWNDRTHPLHCPYGAPGDRLWVRETWFPDPPIDGSWPGDISWQDERRIDGVPEHYRKPRHCIFAASWTGIDLRWRPGIHMPRWASRITLEITGVRVERLHAITEDDARAEGVDGPHWGRWTDLEGRLTPPESAPARPWAHSFFVAWSEINGRDSLWANPWVWVVEFRRLEAQERAA